MLTNNFYNLLKSCAGGLNNTLNPVYDLSGSVKIYKQYPRSFGNFFYPESLGYSFSSPGQGYASSYPKILLGKDSAIPSRDELSFSPIQNVDSSSSEYLKTSLGFKVYPHIEDNTVSCTHHIQIIGKNSSPVTITKLGLAIYGEFGTSASSFSSYTLLDATSLSSPITINNGDTVFLDYTLSMNLSLNIF